MERRVELIKKLITWILVVSCLLATAGCSHLPFSRNTKGTGEKGNSVKGQGAKTSPMPIDPYEQAKEVKITLYFKHEVADFLVPEERTVLQDKQSPEQLVVEELLKGPKKFERLLVMPPETKIIDVTRKADTVFVNLTDDFQKPIDLSTVPGREDTSGADIPKVQARLKRLAIYSIVNSLTYLSGVNHVQLMVNNRQLTYHEMGAELLIEDGSELSPDSPMVAIERDKRWNLTPARTAGLVLNALTAEPDWDIIYMFLSDKTMDGDNLPPLDEFKKEIPSISGGIIAFEDDPVLDQEYLGEKALVNVKYTDKTVDTLKEVNEVLTADDVEGIWKIRLPAFISRLRQSGTNKAKD
ncbi:MAG TPA: hypothetical protein DDW86_04020 [Clostridiales bacterium]|jgi:hypothetical protein|nr:hypothetical protein [Clostridiales bacterium]